jgi:L-ascorbate metabolism protein UlaG (beta-lactamase superfamily)
MWRAVSRRDGYLQQQKKARRSRGKVMATIHRVVLTTQTEEIDRAHGTLFFIGTATVLLRYAGFTVLTDPNFLREGEQVHLGYGVRARRLANPALDFGALPPLDLVLLSHLHEDHFDRLVARRLHKDTPIVTTPRTAQQLEQKGFRHLYPLTTWQSLSLLKGERELRITALPARHGPGPIARLLPEVMGSMLEFVTVPAQMPYRLYISGDTLLYKGLREIPQRYPAIDLGLFHLGGEQFVGLSASMNAKKGVEAISLLKPCVAIPIHYDDYTNFSSPLDEFQQLVHRAKLKTNVQYVQRGYTYTFAVPVPRN